MSQSNFVSDRVARAVEEDAAVSKRIGESMVYDVKSSSSDSVYEVDLEENTCTCMDFMIRCRGENEGRQCKHIIRVVQCIGQEDQF